MISSARHRDNDAIHHTSCPESEREGGDDAVTLHHCIIAGSVAASVERVVVESASDSLPWRIR